MFSRRSWSEVKPILPDPSGEKISPLFVQGEYGLFTSQMLLQAKLAPFRASPFGALPFGGKSWISPWIKKHPPPHPL